MTNKLDIGLLGCGRWGRNILRDLIALNCKVSVYDPDPEVQSKVDSDIAAKCTFSTDIISFSKQHDGFVVASPSNQHYLCLLSLLAYDRPIFCEKPICANANHANEIARLAPQQVFVMEKWRYHSGIQALADIARSGELGPVQQLRTIRVQLGQPHKDVDGCWVLTPHDLSIVDQILGEIPPLLAATGDFTDGNLDGVLAIFGESPAAIIETSSRHPYTNRQIILSCQNGVAALESPLAEHINIIRFKDSTSIDPATSEQRSIPATMPLFEELKHFCEYIRGGPAPLVNAVKGAQMVQRLTELRLFVENS